MVLNEWYSLIVKLKSKHHFHHSRSLSDRCQQTAGFAKPERCVHELSELLRLENKRPV